MPQHQPRTLPETVAHSILVVLTWSYSGSYAYHNVKPIEAIRSSQDDPVNLIRSLAHFRSIKNEELVFVSRAVCQP